MDNREEIKRKTLRPRLVMCGIISLLFLGIGLSILLLDRAIADTPIGILYILLAWLLAWVIVTCCTGFWYTIRLFLERNIKRLMA